MTTAPNCPKCGKFMEHRRSKGREFYGCSQFPRCRGYLPMVASAARTPKLIEKPSKYQAAVFDFIQYGTGHAVIEAVAGCLAASTIIEVNRAGKSYKCRIDNLVKMINGGTRGGRKFNTEIKTRIRSLDQDGKTIVLRDVIYGVYSGVKATYTVQTASGKKIRATKDHKFLTTDGWKRLEDLSIGMYLLTDAGKGRGKIHRKKPTYNRMAGMKNHPFHHRSKPNFSVWTHRLVVEADINNLSLEEFVTRIKNNEIKNLSFLNPREFHVHHKDENPLNNSIDNLCIQTPSQHYTHHAAEGGWKNVQAMVSGDKISSIKPYGWECTYDLTMDPSSSRPCFLANGIVVHNSGKTTTMVHALSIISNPEDAAFVAFNKHIADELSLKAPAGVDVGTMHSLGFRALNQEGRKLVRDKKVSDIAGNLLKPYESRFKPEVLKAMHAGLCRLASLSKATLIDTNDKDEVLVLMNAFDVEICEDAAPTGIVIGLLPNVMQSCLDEIGVVDYDDMLWHVVARDVPMRRYSWVFIDEAQDLNNCQMELALRMVKPGGRIIAVGDSRQSIYAFRCANSSAMKTMTTRLQATTLPLSICYRCPKKHVELAKELVPHIEAADTAIKGEVEQLYEYEVISKVVTGDMILCRVNAPLVPMAFELIRSGVKAVVRGRDIGRSLTALMDKVGGKTVRELCEKIIRYQSEQVAKLTEQEKHGQAESLSDRCECVLAIATKCDSVQAMKAHIEGMFSDKQEGVTLSSVHRSKGLEANRVFILKPELLPHPRAKGDEAMQQERNINYVALTRAKQYLGFVMEN